MMRQLKRVAAFVVSLGVMTMVFTAIWGTLITDNLYNCTDAVGFDYLQPGNWVHGDVAFVTHVRAGRSMSEPDTIKEGWTVRALWALWLSFCGCSLTASSIAAGRFSASRRAAEALHRMSGAHICSRFGWLWMPLIGDLDRSAAHSQHRQTIICHTRF